MSAVQKRREPPTPPAGTGTTAEGAYSCGVKKPFSGKGSEGNYDTDSRAGQRRRSPTTATARAARPAQLLEPQVADGLPIASYRELDYGDFLSWHWERSNREDFLARLNPLHAEQRPRLRRRAVPARTTRSRRAACSSSPAPPATADRRRHQPALRRHPRLPLLVPQQQLADNKCADTTAPYFTKGFETIANQSDAAWTCRRPYLILVTDGENNCSGENVAADVANLFTKTRTQTWVVNLGGNLTGVVNNGKGEEVFVDTEEQLRDEMRQIVGTIEQEKRAFASAAVPSVQADVADKIYLTQFTPLNGQSVWPAKVDAYLKPLADRSAHPPARRRPSQPPVGRRRGAARRPGAQTGGGHPAARQRRAQDRHRQRAAPGLLPARAGRRHRRSADPPPLRPGGRHRSPPPTTCARISGAASAWSTRASSWAPPTPSRRP